MDNLITLIIIIIAVLSLLGKIQTKKRKDAGSEGAGGWIDRLDTFLTDLQNKIEQQANPTASDSSGWDELTEDERYEDEEPYDADEYSLKELAVEEDKPKPGLAEEKITPAEPSARTQTLPVDTLGPVIGKAPRAALSVMQARASITSKDRNDLRKGIIWSEILGPPLSLRDPFGNQK